MKLRLLLALPALLLAPLLTHAQTYEPGLLVRSSGDTLRGEIENGFWVEPPEFIRFRTAPGSPSQVFKPEELRAVKLTNGRNFRYALLPIDHSAETRINNLPRGYVPAVHQDWLLAEVLLEGAASLFRVVTPGTTHYLVQREQKPVLDLCERKYLTEGANGLFRVANANNYRGELGIYFGDCAPAYQAAAAAPFTEAGLIEVLQSYNKACSAVHQPARNWLASARPRRPVSWQGGLLAGARYNPVTSLGDQNEEVCADCRLRPMAGLYSELLLPSRTLSIYGELSLSSFRARYILYNYWPNIRSLSYANYEALLGTARIGMRQYFPLPRGKNLLIGLGYEWNTVLRPKFSNVVAIDPSNTVTITPPTPGLTAKPLHYLTQTFLPGLSVGWQCQRLTLVADAQRCGSDKIGSESIVDVWIGDSWSTRLSATYRLGRNHDQLAAGH